MIKKIDIITSTCIPLPQENVDTDQIIPARFLKAVSREGFGGKPVPPIGASIKRGNHSRFYS